MLAQKDDTLGKRKKIKPGDHLRVRFFGRIRKRICDSRSYGFFDTKETQNPKKDYFTRQAGGTQYIFIYIYIYIRTIFLVLP